MKSQVINTSTSTLSMHKNMDYAVIKYFFFYKHQSFLMEIFLKENLSSYIVFLQNVFMLLLRQNILLYMCMIEDGNIKMIMQTSV